MVQKGILKFVLVVGDFFLMIFSLILTLAIRYKDFSFLPGPQSKVFLFHFSIIGFFWILFLYALNFYELPPFKKLSDFFRNLVVFFLIAAIFGISYFYLQPSLQISPKTILFLDILFFCLFLFGWRYLIAKILGIKKFKEKIAIIGVCPELKELFKDPNLLSQEGFELIAFFEPHFDFQTETQPFAQLAKHGIISDPEHFKEVIKKEEIDSIILALKSYKDKRLIREVFSNLPLKLNYVSFIDFYESLTKKVPIEAVDEIWLLENISRKEKKFDEILKRIFDATFASLGLTITAVLFPFIAFFIKLNSPGPIFYPQKRIGKDGKIFTLYKFRTMKVSPNQNRALWREKDPNQITGVGKILRRIHFDEFPQFFNILKGDLSFVGPRPEWVELAKIFEREIPFYSLRYLIKPGFTGWAQIHFPASTSIEEAKEKFQYDLYYLKNRSLFLDLRILLKTFQLFFKKE